MWVICSSARPTRNRIAPAKTRAEGVQYTRTPSTSPIRTAPSPVSITNPRSLPPRLPGVLRGSSAPARHAQPPPDEQHDPGADDDRDRKVERLQRVPDRHPVRAELHAGEDEQHRPDEGPGGRIDDECPDRHPG